MTYYSTANRLRRNRKNASIRSLLRETVLSVDDIICPLFALDKGSECVPINSMPGQFRLGHDLIIEKARELYQMGIKAIALFPVIPENKKDNKGSFSYNKDNHYFDLIKKLKDTLPEMQLMTDVALDPYSSDGHDGIVDPKSKEILNDETLDILAKMAIEQAKAGSDIIGPSDMMDFRVGYIRKALDENSFSNVSIMSYTAKYASSFYGPFREALDSAPKSGDKKSYQMDFSNANEALLEAKNDESEGADILMVKPGLSYLDIIYRLKQSTNLPIAAYNVSGEYSMIMAAGERGWINSQEVMIETLTSFKRAGADIILTYFAEEMARLMN